MESPVSAYWRRDEQLYNMHQEYLTLLIKFYEKAVEGSRQAQLLKHSLERFLNYQFKEQEKLSKQREKEGSLRSASSNSSLSGFEKVKKLFYSNNLETALLFYYSLNRIKNAQASLLIRLLTQAADRLKTIKTSFPTAEERRKFNTKLAKFTEQVQFLQGRVAEGRAIDWLYFEVFKEFESEAVLAAQLLSTAGDALESREVMKAAEYGQLLRALKAACCVFDYSTREVQIMGEGQRIFIGRRSDTYFVLTEKEFEKASASQAMMAGNRKQLGRAEDKKEGGSYSTNKFKEEFLAEMVKLRQGYEANTATIASLFHFKDAGDARTLDQIHQA